MRGPPLRTPALVGAQGDNSTLSENIAASGHPSRISYRDGSASTGRRPMKPLNTVVGTAELSAWQPVPGVTWVQTRSPQFARKLSQRQDSRLVVRGVFSSNRSIRTPEARL
jgi:hypothetical protein